VYALCGCVTIHRLLRLRGPLWLLIFLVALAITLIPTPLLEPRYFTPGVVLAILNSPPVRTVAISFNLGATPLTETYETILRCSKKTVLFRLG
jgi:membrane glycosyltransferase